MKKVILTLTPEQAVAVRDALDLYSRICIGQIEEIGQLVRFGTVPMRKPADMPREMADADRCEEIARLLNGVKTVLGYSISGSNGIGHPHVDASGHRAYEVKKVLAKALAEHRDPAPQFRGVDYDGLTVRYTQDPAPVVEVANG
ncbi:MAG: hypothetical protein KJZ90_01240 [Rhodocyclaceae bacterium]|nr:hypothetical protein [Rhodocyclaceae bacterium]